MRDAVRSSGSKSGLCGGNAKADVRLGNGSLVIMQGELMCDVLTSADV